MSRINGGSGKVSLMRRALLTFDNWVKNAMIMMRLIRVKRTTTDSVSTGFLLCGLLFRCFRIIRQNDWRFNLII